MRIILASQSPRRRELLEMLGYPFEVKVSEAEEKITSTNPAQVTEELSCQKAETVAEMIQEGLVIGADTVVSQDDKILGKPMDRQDAREMIQILQGRNHKVYTGVTVIERKAGWEVRRVTFSEETIVKVASMTSKEVEQYISLPEPYDKAGGYGIQGKGALLVEKIEGDYFNIVGLPISLLYKELRGMGVSL